MLLFVWLIYRLRRELQEEAKERCIAIKQAGDIFVYPIINDILTFLNRIRHLEIINKPYQFASYYERM